MTGNVTDTPKVKTCIHAHTHTHACAHANTHTLTVLWYNVCECELLGMVGLSSRCDTLGPQRLPHCNRRRRASATGSWEERGGEGEGEGEGEGRAITGAVTRLHMVVM